MGDIVNLKPTSLVEDHGFVVDLARFREGLVDEKAIRKKYRLANDVWEKLGDDDELIRKVEEESVRRIRDGSSKREKAQLLVVKAPDVVSAIMLDDTANARHRIDAAASLDKLAANPADNMPAASDRFVIQINLGSDLDGRPIIETYDKSIAIDANDGEPNNPNPAPFPTTAKGKKARNKPIEINAGDGGVDSDSSSPGTGPRPRGKLLTGFLNKWDSDDEPV